MENNKFESKQKSIVKIFNIIFWCGVIGVAYEIIFKILFLTNIINHDVTEYTLLHYIISFIYLGVMFACVKFAKKGSIYAGILGIIVGILEILVAGLLWEIIGAILIVDSIVYLVNYNKSK